MSLHIGLRDARAVAIAGPELEQRLGLPLLSRQPVPARGFGAVLCTPRPAPYMTPR